MLETFFLLLLNIALVAAFPLFVIVDIAAKMHEAAEAEKGGRKCRY